jgi:hypothetical protein
MMDMFYRKDPNIQFRELAQLRKMGTPDSYVREFQWMEVIVTDVSEKRLVMFFMKGLVEPLRDWVKAFNPNTLQKSIMKTQDMENAIPKKTSTKNFIPQKGQVMNPP